MLYDVADKQFVDLGFKILYEKMFLNLSIRAEQNYKSQRVAFSLHLPSCTRVSIVPWTPWVFK